MSGSFTCGGGENDPSIPGACAPAILRILQEAHAKRLSMLRCISSTSYTRHTSFSCIMFCLSDIHDDVIKWKLALCTGNSPVPGEFPTQRPVARGAFDIYFDLRLNKRLSKQSWGWWFQTPSCPLWRHCNAYLLVQMESCAWLLSRLPHWSNDKLDLVSVR